MKIKVLVIDDSALIRNILKEIINEQPDMTVVGAAPDPLVAREMIRTLNPDVLTLDIEMPNMNGLSFLKRLMRVRPMPVVMLSSHTQEGSDIAFRALAMGAVDFVGKPVAGEGGEEDYPHLIVEKIRAAHAARDKIVPLDISRAVDADEVLPNIGNSAVTQNNIIVIGASTGGAEALKDILTAMPEDCPPILIAQHMPGTFTKLFAKRLDGLCKIAVKEAEDEEPALPGHAYVAPGGFHLRLERYGKRGYGIKLSQDPPVNLHRPSVDVLFDSAAENAESDAVGVILTGMGKDGAQGLLHMRQKGSFTLAQDEATSIVFGMPKEAIELGAAVAVAPLPMIARRILSHLAGADSPAGVATGGKIGV
ncbi:MAG TPA: chemotaxis response regulator protein-glutamate methylesterase [Usitatibacteraceae bacterium]|nr:chemotaxis response regulator protein-glutamate methylesterase [Usitatibacteraceae bacterium]